jgi:hypothetical protein
MLHDSLFSLRCFCSIVQGPYPSNITAVQINLSFNNLSGPLVLRKVGGNGVNFLNLQWAGQFDCYVRMDFTGPASTNSISTLSLRGTMRPGCDIMNFNQIQLPQTSLKWLDVSENEWMPWVIPEWMLRLRALWAEDSNVIGMIDTRPLSRLPLELLEIHLSGNVMAPEVRGLSQIDQWMRLLDAAKNLRLLGCNYCNLQFDFGLFCDSIYKDSAGNGELLHLYISHNKLTGNLPYTLFGANQPDLPWSISSLDISYNWDLGGLFGEASNTFGNSLNTLNLAGTYIRGSLPETYRALTALRSLTLLDMPQLTCTMQVNAKNLLECPLPSWIVTTSTLSDFGVNGQFVGFKCPQLQVADTVGLSTVAIDELYYAYRFCPVSGILADVAFLRPSCIAAPYDSQLSPCYASLVLLFCL